MDKDTVESLEQHLDGLIETSRQIGIMASNFQQTSQNVLNQKFSSLVNCLRKMDAMKDNFSEVKVPVSVFNYIDDGKNPVLYTKDCLLHTLKKNEEIKGKIVTFKTFREQLIDDLSRSFPDEYKEYTKLREEESKQQEQVGAGLNMEQAEETANVEIKNE